MADNKRQYGFRWSTAYNGHPCPQPISLSVATGYQATDGAAANVHIYAGDPLVAVAGGGVEMAAAGANIDYICVGVEPYWDGTVMTPKDHLPGGTAWGTVEERISKVLCVPAQAGLWEIDCDDNTTATTKAAYRLLIGNNADHILTGNADNKAWPELDISTAGTATDGWRIINISQTVANEDFSGQYVKLIVAVNESNAVSYTTTGV